MNSDREISFNEAWKDFLIIRPIPYKSGAWIYLDSNQKVTRVDFAKFLKLKEIEGKRYFCDDSTIPSMTICYPEQIVVSEFENKIAKLLLGKPFEKWKRDVLKGKSEHLRRKVEAQLGGARKSEVQEIYSRKRYWEALFSLHQILNHRLRKLLMYKSMDIDYSSSKILINSVKENICKEIKWFSQLINSALLIGAIKDDTKEELVRFNEERNQIAHDLLEMTIHRSRLKSQCEHGLKLMDILEDSFSEIIPKPKFIKMSKFEVKSIKVPKERST